jgi:RNA polymerase sigma-70 factor (ECF subfamily)
MLSSPPDTRASLILRLPNAADVAAWDEFVAVYEHLVFRLALRRGLQPADAEDLVQEVFSAVANQIGEWLQRSDRGRFRAWLLRIARNIAVSLLTRRPHGTRGVGGDDSARSLAQIPAPPDEFSSQFDLEYHREVIRWAAEQVREKVSENTWRAFQLTHVEGVAIADAARQLGMSVGNVYIARSRVVSRLRDVAQQFEVRE